MQKLGESGLFFFPQMPKSQQKINRNTNKQETLAPLMEPNKTLWTKSKKMQIFELPENEFKIIVKIMFSELKGNIDTQWEKNQENYV